MNVDVGVCMCVGGFPLVQQLYPERLSKSVRMGGQRRGVEDTQQLVVSSETHQNSLKCQQIRKAHITLNYCHS